VYGIESAFSIQWGPFGPILSVEGVAPHQPFFLPENYDELTFMWYKNLGTSCFRFVTIHAFDRQKDFGSTVHCITYSHMVKKDSYSVILWFTGYCTCFGVQKPVDQCIFLPPLKL